MLTLRLDSKLESYLDSRTNNKSEYVRELIKKDKKKNQNVQPKTEYERCKNNIQYFTKNYCFIKDPKKGKVSLDPYDYQRNVLDRLKSGASLLIVKGRQMGITTLFSVYSLWRCLFYNNETIGYRSVKRENCKMFLNKVRFIYDNLPDWLRKPRFIDNKMEIEFQNNSKVVGTGYPPKRGTRYSTIIIDEASFINNLEKYWSELKAMVDKNGHGQYVIASNGILKDNNNYPILSDFYQNNWMNNIQLSYLEHPDRDQSYRDEIIGDGIMSREQFLKEHGALVEVDDE